MSSKPQKQTPHRDYVCPPEDAAEDDRLSWFAEAHSEGMAYLGTQPGFNSLDKAIDIISGKFNDELPTSNVAGGAMSRIRANIIKRGISEQVSVLTDLRDFWQFEANDKEKWEHHSAILNNLTNDWYHSQFVDLSIKEALQYAAVLGSGYLKPYWKVNKRNGAKSNIALQSYGARDVLPIQLPSNHDLQDAYAIIIRDEMPITMVWRTWPHLQHRIKPDREIPTTVGDAGSILGKAARAAMDFMNPTKNREDDDTPFPTVDIFYVYVDDFSINKSGSTRPMGKVGTNFYYEVPTLGGDVPTGSKNSGGQQLYRKAERDDCQLYPNRRLIICTREVVIYDGPSYWWHGQVPLIKFNLDEWAWNYLGFSMVLEVASISESYNNHLRNIDDSAAARLNPPFLWDKNSIAEKDAKRFNVRRPNMQMMYDNFKNENPIKFPVPAEYYNVPDWIINRYIPFLQETLNNILGIPDLRALAKAKQVPSGDSIEKLAEMAGPIVRGMSRSMERSLRGLGEQVGSLFFQFYDMRRRLHVLGKDGVTEEDFDFDPMSLVPGDEQGFRASRMDRARLHQNNFQFRVTPGSLHQINATSRKLLYLQLQRGGFKIDSETVAKVMDIPAWGHLPGQTVLEKWGAEQDLNATIQGQLANAAQGGAAGDGNRPGRPPSGQAEPKLVSKDGGSRSTITESR